MSDDFNDINVSRETKTILETYIDELLKWNKSFSLISRNLSKAELVLHIKDSIGLANLINNKNFLPTKRGIADIGSGNGLPGLILTILGIEGVELIEINYKKCVFLNEVKRRLSFNYKVVNSDVTKLNNKYDILVSKAFTSVIDFLNKSASLIDKNSTVYLLKSLNQTNEIEVAKQNWKFDLNIYNNEFNNSSAIIEIKNIRYNDCQNFCNS